MRLLTLTLVLLLAVSISPLLAQVQKEHAKGSYVDSLNRYYHQVDLPVYIFVSTSPDGTNSTPLKEITDKEKEIQPIYLDGHGIHNLRHMDAIHQKVDVFQIYGDGRAPVTKLTAENAPTFKDKDGKIFYGKGLEIKLSSTDEMSGVKNIYISLNGADFEEYTGKEDFSKEGDYTIGYYAVDRVGNAETPKFYSFTVDLTPPRTFHNIVGIASGSVISTASNIYLDIEDSSSGIKETRYSFDDTPSKLLTGREIPFKQLDNGDHVLHYWSVDKVGNEEKRQSLSFYLDKIVPIASMDILGDKFIVGDKIYFSGRTKVKLTAVDNRTGIKEIKYSMNNSVYQEYKEPFYMPNKAGLYTIKYYAVDDVGNRNEGEDFHSRGVIYVDLSGPVLNYSLSGPVFKKGDVTYVGAKTRFGITGKDAESGLQYLSYTINNGNEIKYQQPFAIGTVGGEYTITYIGYDNVNNSNEAKVKLMLDVNGPEIKTHFSAEPDGNEAGIAIYPSYVQLFISATDLETTATSVFYSINSDRERQYTAPIRGFEKNKKYTIKIRAVDALENESVDEITFEISDY